MALVSCPECGRKNISDTAEHCPACGFAVGKYFEQKQNEKREIQEDETYKERVEKEYKKFGGEIKERMDKVDELKPCEIPLKPNLFVYLFFHNRHPSLVLWWIIGLIILICFKITALLNVWVYLGGFISIIFTFWSYTYSQDEYKNKRREYEIQNKDFNKYKYTLKENIKNEYRSYAENMVMYGSIFSPNENETKKIIPKIICPNCGSEKTRKISSMGRALSVFAWGGASSKIAKQFECDDCKYKW